MQATPPREPNLEPPGRPEYRRQLTPEQLDELRGSRQHRYYVIGGFEDLYHKAQDLGQDLVEDKQERDKAREEMSWATEFATQPVLEERTEPRRPQRQRRR